ncbi:PhzF family phenazine biosynthesis protein [Cytobacillus purgationiresistens]|uniref:PhzF family phenazine biosynthesis protein n=1 Tax=Cytobacillus purgationiresistens TaxID=863449 RepID=A0ABU0AKT2_9BACI|nr:PhzF family phenazine biosynthesis protein [Cytobacillus purgationiresistens]MDQ0271870.1 PhzF family phenazine biosynthesis protein [Cytobacillus purgationiresistens]
MKNIRVYYVDAFTSTKFEGNTAGVVLDAELLSLGEMQKIAKELNLPETVFLLPSTSEDADYKVKYFSPTHEVNFCGHATVGLAWILLSELGLKDQLNPLTFETNIGNIPVAWAEENGQLQSVEMTQVKPSIKSIEINVKEISRLTGVKEESIDYTYPIKLANTGNWHLLIPVTDFEAINEAVPNLADLAKFNKELNISTTHLFTFHTEDGHDLYTRDFAPAIGIPEDPVTGAANGALAGYLFSEGIISQSEITRMKIAQGNAIGRPGTLYVTVIPEADGPIIKVGGSAIISLRGSIRL